MINFKDERLVYRSSEGEEGVSYQKGFVKFKC